MSFLALKMIGLKGLLGNLTSAQAGGVTSSLEKKMGEAVEIAKGRAKILVTGSREGNPPKQLGTVTGGLANSIQGWVEKSGQEVLGVIGSNKIYAAVHEFGATIRPKSRTFLRWVDPRTGEYVFAKMVRIPPRPYLSRAIEEMTPQISDILGQAIVAAVRGR